MHSTPFDLLTQLEFFLRKVPLVDILVKSVLEILLREGQDISSQFKKSEDAQNEGNGSELSVVKKTKNSRTWKCKGSKICHYPLK